MKSATTSFLASNSSRVRCVARWKSKSVEYASWASCATSSGSGSTGRQEDRQTRKIEYTHRHHLKARPLSAGDISTRPRLPTTRVTQHSTPRHRARPIRSTHLPPALAARRAGLEARNRIAQSAYDVRRCPLLGLEEIHGEMSMRWRWNEAVVVRDVRRCNNRDCKIE